MAVGATTAAAHRNIVLNAVKACGTIITIGQIEFLEILSHLDDPLVVYAEGGVFTKHYRYLTSYRGLAFTCKSSMPLEVPMDAELIAAKKITIPDL